MRPGPSFAAGRDKSGPAVGRAPDRPFRAPGRGEEGLTTLEWLLVVAAVAGLAALAVVLVQNVVGDTAEQVASNDARQTAADLSVTELAERWRAEVPADQPQADEINRRYSQRCSQLGIIYADISLKVEAKDGDFDTNAGRGWGPDTKNEPACQLF